MKKYTLLLLVSFISFGAYSQVGGLSASKLGTLCTTTVPEGTIEFEPFFGVASSKNHFDNNGDVQESFLSSDSTMKFSESGFRFSYGLIKNLELGVSLPIDVSEVNFGAKYKLPFGEKFTMGILAGYNAVVGNRISACRSAVCKDTPAYVGGMILTYDFSNKFSIDFDAQYHQHKRSTLSGHTHGINLNSDIGYYFLEKVNFIIGLNYGYQAYDLSINNSYLLSLNTGIAIEKAENYILVLNAPFDLMGKNEYRTKGFGLALTIMLD